MDDDANNRSWNLTKLTGGHSPQHASSRNIGYLGVAPLAWKPFLDQSGIAYVGSDRPSPDPHPETINVDTRNTNTNRNTQEEFQISVITEDTTKFTQERRVIFASEETDESTNNLVREQNCPDTKECKRKMTEHPQEPPLATTEPANQHFTVRDQMQIIFTPYTKRKKKVKIPPATENRHEEENTAEKGLTVDSRIILCPSSGVTNDIATILHDQTHPKGAQPAP